MFNLFSKKKGEKESRIGAENMYTKEMYSLLNQVGNENLGKITEFINGLDYNTTAKILEKLDKEHKYIEAVPIIFIAQKKFSGDSFLAYISGKILSSLSEHVNEQQNPTVDTQIQIAPTSKL